MKQIFSIQQNYCYYSELITEYVHRVSIA